MRLSVFGLGKLGTPLAAVLATKGYSVVGYDTSVAAVEAMNARRPIVAEPGLSELLQILGPRLRATTVPEDAVLDSDITFILVPTPSDPDGHFSLRFVLDAARTIGAALREKRAYHLVALMSTVVPGMTAGRLVPALETATRRRCGEDFGVCYNPLFVALGTVMRDLLQPEFVLIGESDPRAGEFLSDFYNGLLDGRPPVARMSFVNAELVKLAVNTFVSTKISFANMLAEMCDRLPGADIDTISAALGLDSRIGGRSLRGGLGYGGPCFPRDNVMLATFARSLGITAELAEATTSVNRRQVDRIIDHVKMHASLTSVVGILGLAYKPHTPVIEESQSLALAARLADVGYTVMVYDPVATDAARAVLGSSVVYAESVARVVREADVLVIATPWDEFRHVSAELLVLPTGNRKTVIDAWRLLDAPEVSSVADVCYLGRNSRCGTGVGQQR